MFEFETCIKQELLVSSLIRLLVDSRFHRFRLFFLWNIRTVVIPLQSISSLITAKVLELVIS